jgi:2,3-bisphosphoglycerate-dependent phosphoglycerate mutase
MQLYYIRHAQSYNNALWTETGSDEGRKEDPELTEMGIRQAEIVADFLKNGDPRGGISRNGSSPGGFGITHIYSSLMVRSVKTGTIIAKSMGLTLKGWQEIHERGGIYLRHEPGGDPECLPGKDRSYFETHYPDFVLPDNFIDTGWWNKKPVETSEVCHERARSFLYQLMNRHAGTNDRVAIISHGGFYNDFLWATMDLPYHKGAWFLMYNTAISRFDFLEDHVRVAYQNRVDHLKTDMLT